MCNCGIQTILPESITQATDTTTITLPSTFEPVNGGIYDISLATAIPEGTDGNIIVITNGTVSGNLLNRLGSNVRMGLLNAQYVLRVMFLEDPAHYNYIGKRWRNVN